MMVSMSNRNRILDRLRDYRDDGKLVGSREILNSPNVYYPEPLNNSPVPVPSVFRDGRGEIHNLQFGAARVNVLVTKGGVLRSGDIHPTTQHDAVLAGRVRVYTLNRDGTTDCCEYYGAGNSCGNHNNDNSTTNRYVAIPPFVPHIFEFLEDDTTLLEWWDGPFEAWYYQPYRALVQDSLEDDPAHHPQQGSLLRSPEEETVSSSSSGKNSVLTALSNVLQSSGLSDVLRNNNLSKPQLFYSGLALGLLSTTGFWWMRSSRRRW